MCTLFNLKPDDLFFKWEAYSWSSSTKDRVISGLDRDGARDLHTYLRQQQASQATAAVSTPASVKVRALPRSVARNFLGASSSRLPSSPLAAPRQTTQSAAVTAAPTPSHHPKAKYTPSDSLADYQCWSWKLLPRLTPC